MELIGTHLFTDVFTLRDLRLRVGMTQRDFAKAIGYRHTNAVVNAEKGENPAPRFIRSVIEHFDKRGQTVEYLGSGRWLLRESDNLSR